jgi:hypothetical protein
MSHLLHALRRGVVLGAGLLGAGLLVSGPALAEPRTSRRTVSASGVYRVQLVEDAPGSCRLRVEDDSGPRWVLPRCVGAVDDTYFVSRDGAHVWVLHTLPEKGGGKGRRLKAGRRWVQVPGYADVVVAEKFDRRGERLDARRLSQLLSPLGYEEVREMARHFSWLEGVNGVPGKGPRLNARGQVELETIEGKTVVLPLK